MSFLIPTQKPDAGIVARFGRLLHWTALGLVAICCICFVLQEIPARTPQSPMPAAPASAATDGPWTHYASPQAAPKVDSDGYPLVPPPAVAPDNEFAPEKFGLLPATPAETKPKARNFFDQFDPPRAPARDSLGGYLLQAIPTQSASGGLPGPVFLFFAAVVFLIGRGARYLFAGE